MVELPIFRLLLVQFHRVVTLMLLCETLITWKNSKKEFITRGLDSDQTVSAIKATEKMLNIIN
jgi:D-citramalate synthase